MRTAVEWTSAAERARIIDAALGLLERVGMRFGRGDALVALAAAGARVDEAAGVARLPRALVQRTLAGCPREIVLGGATPADDCLLTPGVPHYVNSGSPTSILDVGSGERRAAVADDLRAATIVLDQMPSVSILWALVSSTDLMPARTCLEELAIMFALSGKHVQHEVEGRWQVEPIRRMAEAAGGDLRTRPRISLVCCTASPLHAHTELLDASTDLAALGVPVAIYPMPIAGATAPLTPAGAATMTVAEFLGAMTAVQLRAPGAPLIMAVGTGLLDMRQTTYCFGALEAGLATAIAVEVGHELGVPCLAAGLSTDAKHPGAQAAYEKALKGFAVSSTRPDLMTGTGMLQAAGLACLPQIVIDDEIQQMILRLLAGAEVSEETVMAATMERLGFAGQYLLEKDTRRRLRAGEVFLPRVSDRQSYEHWRAGGGDEVAAAEQRVRDILAAAPEREPRLDDDQLAELESCVAAAAAAAPA